MKGCTTWSYTPYQPLLYDVGTPYVCRVVPSETAVTLEWLSASCPEYRVLVRAMGQGEFTVAGSTAGTAFTVENLVCDTDYEFVVTCEAGQSRVRLARTGRYPGTVVNYLHPQDRAYGFSGQYLCSPSMVRHPDGYLLSSMDLFEGGAPQNLTLIFRSDDNGATWHYVAELMPCFWGKLFIHRGDVYMLSCSTEYGDLLISRSEDGGMSFPAPVCLLRGLNGKAGSVGVHKNPEPLMVRDGRLWGTLEWGSWGNREYYHAVMVMSCPEDADLTDPENWTFSEPVKYDPAWPGVVKGGHPTGNIEGSLAVAPDGTFYNIMRYGTDAECDPPYGLVLAYRVDPKHPEAPLTYDHAIRLDCNNSKFTILFDEVSRMYYCIGSRIDGIERIGGRNLLSLWRSEDLEHWELYCDLMDGRALDMRYTGFQYCDMMFDGDDLIYACRTGISGAHSYHDSNCQTFHRVKNFRSLPVGSTILTL